MNTTNKVNTKNMTQPMELALKLAARNGAVFAGKGNEVARGSATSVEATTIRALALRGLLDTSIGPDGGMMGRLTEAGAAEAQVAGYMPKEAMHDGGGGK